MPGYWKRVAYAFRTFFSILDDHRIPGDVLDGLGTRTATPEVAEVELPASGPASPAGASSDRAIQLLAILQRDGRLVDFLMEDLAGYPDAQIGAAVRDVHAACRQALTRYVALEPILDGPEEQPVTVEPGLDPAAIRLVGNVTGTPPFRGVLRHRGWRSAGVDLPPLPEGEGRAVIAPAEVEVP